MNYRNVWMSVNGPIPLDEDGRTYEIHHIDGNRSNNCISNLKCVSIKDHYNIHYEQGDYSACSLIQSRYNIDELGSFDIMSNMATQSNKKRLDEGTHNFTTESHRENNKHVQKKLFEDGVHHFCEGQSRRGQKSHSKKEQMWKELNENEFFELIKKYKLYVTKKLRSGVVSDTTLNSMIIQAINVRYELVERKTEFFLNLMRYHNVNETYLFTEQHVNYYQRRSRKRPTKCH